MHHICAISTYTQPTLLGRTMFTKAVLNIRTTPTFAIKLDAKIFVAVQERKKI